MTPAARASSPGRSPRGLTLLETLVALSIVIALGSIAGVVLTGLFERSTFQRAIGVVDEHVRMSRAHARGTGEAVELIVDLEHNRLIARRLLGDDGAPREDTFATAFRGAPMVDARIEDPRSIEESWASTGWPDGVRLAWNDPRDPSMLTSTMLDEVERLDMVDDPRVVEGASTMQFGHERSERRLGVILPDGTAAAPTTMFLWDGRRRLVRCDIDRLRGAALFTDLDWDAGIDPTAGDDDETPADSAAWDASTEGRPEDDAGVPAVEGHDA